MGPIRGLLKKLCTCTGGQHEREIEIQAAAVSYAAKMRCYNKQVSFPLLPVQPLAAQLFSVQHLKTAVVHAEGFPNVENSSVHQVEVHQVGRLDQGIKVNVGAGADDANPVRDGDYIRAVSQHPEEAACMQHSAADQSEGTLQQQQIATAADIEPRPSDSRPGSQHNGGHSARHPAAGAGAATAVGATPLGSAAHALQFTQDSIQEVFGDRQRLRPLLSPETLLQDVAAVLGVNDQLHVLAALLALRRAAVHHATMLDDCLEDVVALLLDCLQSTERSVCLAAILVTDDLLRAFGDSLLPHIHNQQESHCMVSCLLKMAVLTCGQGKAVAAAAETTLRYIAGSLHQSSVIKILKPQASKWDQPRLRAKAASLLMVAAYRLS